MVARCFAEDYADEAPARRGEVVRGRAEVLGGRLVSAPGRTAVRDLQTSARMGETGFEACGPRQRQNPTPPSVGR